MKKKTIAMIGLAILSLASFIPSVQALALSGPWGPERDTFTWEVPATYATFNSMTNNPDLGDERNFVRVRAVGDTYYVDEVELRAGKTYEVYSYFHNNAERNIGQTAIGIADNVRMSANFPASIKAGEKLTVNTIISASDTNPLAVWDGAYVTANTDLYLRYVPGSAMVHNGGQLNGQAVGPDYLFSEAGALLGYNTFSGLLPGCNEYAGYVTYQFLADRPDFEISKTVVGDKTKVAEGDIVEFKIRYNNTGTMTQDDVIVRDTLPDGLKYIEDSTILRNNSDVSGSVVSNNIISASGINIGDYAGGNGWAELTYKARVEDRQDCGTKLENFVVVSTENGSKEDSVVITVEDNCAPGELPKAGPAEVVLAVIAVLGVGVGGAYWYRSRKVLQKVTDEVGGK